MEKKVDQFSIWVVRDLVEEMDGTNQDVPQCAYFLQVLSPTGHNRTPSDVSAISIDSFTSSVDTEKPEEEVTRVLFLYTSKQFLARAVTTVAWTDIP